MVEREKMKLILTRIPWIENSRWSLHMLKKFDLNGRGEDLVCRHDHFHTQLVHLQLLLIIRRG